MGGRGGRGGSVGISAKLPGKLSFDYQTYEPPALEGTEKQVKWAEKIRNSALDDMWDYAVSFSSDGRQSDMASIYVDGKNAMLKSIKSDYLINSTSGRVQEEKLRDRINSFSDAKDRMERWHKLAEKKSAKWWIDNRSNTLENYMNKKLKKFIDGK